MILQWRSPLLAALVALLAVAVQADQGKGKPSIQMRSNPTIAFAPARIVATAEITGGADDYADFYCAKVEWDWGDETKSEAQDDCDPYVPGESHIRRRYTNEHRFEFAGNYDVRITLKQGKKSVGSGVIQVRVREGDASRVK
jgi:hypothetical protein